MRLNCREGNGVRLAGRTSRNTARIARTALIALIYSILRVDVVHSYQLREGRNRPLPQIPTANQARVNPTFCRSFFCLNPVAVDAGDGSRELY
jgi:hypothetical protein